MSATYIRAILFSSAFVFLSACGGGGGSENPPPPPPPAPDTTPDAFEFAPAEGYFPKTVVTSEATAITGIDAASPVSITNGEYAIGTGAFTTAGGSITNNQTVRVRGIAGTQAGDTQAVVLTVGGVAGNFAVITADAMTAADTSPTPFRLSDPDPATVNAGDTIVTDPIVVENINASAPITVTPGSEYSLDGGASWTSEAGLVQPGDEVLVRTTAPSTSNSVAEGRLCIGGVCDVMTVITAPAAGEVDSVPAPIDTASVDADVADPYDSAPGQQVTYGPFAVSGIATDVPIAIDGNNGSAEFSLDGGATWIPVGDTTHTVADGSSVLVRLTAPAYPNTYTQAELNIGGVTAVFSVATAAVPYGSDTSPDAIASPEPVTTTVGEPVLFEAVAVTGTDAPVAVSLIADSGVSGEYRINGGAWLSGGTSDTTGTEVSVVAGQTIEVRLTANADAGTSASASLTIGDQTISYTLNLPVAANRAPIADAGSAQSVTAGASVTLDASASSDPDGDTLSYAWRQTDATGTVIILTGADTAAPAFTAPAVTESTAFTFELTISDGTLSATDSVNITVAPEGATNRAPIADAGNAQTVSEGANVTVTLNGSGSSDPDGDALTYLWEQTDTTGIVINLSNATSASATFSAPDVTADKTFTFRLTVSDGTLNATDTSNVTVRFVNQAPVADAGADGTVAEGSLVQLSGSATDPDGDVPTLLWTQTSGPSVTLSNTSDDQPTFTAPAVTASTQLVFRLTATDSHGYSATDSVTITVADTNRAPTANAGDNQNVTVGDSVTLNGSGSDLDNDTLTYAWTQTDASGTTVALSNANSASAAFTAPSVDTTTTLTFTLTVSDGAKSATDSVDISVSPQGTTNLPPLANAGVDQIVNEGATVTLDGTGSSDPENGTLTYAWTRTDSTGIAVSVTGANTATPTFTAPGVNADAVLSFRLTVTDGGNLTSSDDVNVTVRFVNRAPTAHAGVDKAVFENDVTRLLGSGSDQDGDMLTYAWTIPEGFTASGQNTATLDVTGMPDVTQDTPYTFTLTVTDSHDASASDSAVLTVKFFNQQPLISSSHPSVNEGDAFSITITASDPDALSYQWDAVPAGFVVDGTMTSATLNLSTTPDVTETTSYRFYYTVTDEHGASSTSSSLVGVQFVNQAPTVSITGPESADEGASFSLVANGADLDNETLTYSWTLPVGFIASGASSATLNVTATPDVAESTSYTFSVTVTDKHDASVSDSITVMINAVSQAPIVPAGPARAMDEGTFITLIGTASDPDGDAMTYSWSAPSGFATDATNDLSLI